MVDVSKFKDLFISEAEDHLQKLNDNLLALEKKPSNKKLLDELMRSSHTMKSSSATMGYEKMAFLTHVMEDVFDYARNDTLKITPKAIDELFKAVDGLEKSLASVKKSDKELNLDVVARKVKKITGVATEGTGKSVRTSQGKPITKTPTGKKPKVGESVQDVGVLGRFEQKANATQKGGVVQKISHVKVPVERLDNLMDLMEELIIDKMRLEQIVGNGQRVMSNEYKGKENLPSTHYPLRVTETSEELRAVVDHLSRLVSDIQYNVMQVRLVPAGQIFARFPRMVRDLAQKQKKKVDLEISGEDLELDRTIIDKLGEPVMHILRNAIDHGIPPFAPPSPKATRGHSKASGGKEKSYSIRLTARREKDFALIVVENDGRSIDFEKVKQAAVRRNITSSKEVESFNNKQLINLLYHPRLSTKDKVTETSGRGVGLSVVKNFVDGIGGRVIVESPIQLGDRFQVLGSREEKHLTPNTYNLEPKGGTRFTLELPLTLAIIDALLVGVKDSVFAVPFSSVERSVSVPHSDIKSMADQEVAIVDSTDVPLVRLEKVFNLGDRFQVLGSRESKEKNLKLNTYNLKPNLMVVLVRRGKDLAGLVVDRLINEQEIIVKPLPSVLRVTKGFSGSTILGDGKTVLILDVMSLLEDTKKLVRTS